LPKNAFANIRISAIFLLGSFTAHARRSRDARDPVCACASWKLFFEQGGIRSMIFNSVLDSVMEGSQRILRWDLRLKNEEKRFVMAYE